MKKFPVSVALDNIRSALNVGAMFRTSDAAGLEKLYLCGITPTPPHPRIPKTALGSIETVEWEYRKKTIELIHELKNTHQIISVELSKDAQNYTEFKFEKPTLLIFGNELSGVSEEIQALSNATVYVPMFGKKESLNVATTFGILVYEIIRQWRYKP